MLTEWAVLPQRDAHLLGDRHEKIVEHFEHHRVGPGADVDAARQRRHALHHEIAPLVNERAPARLDDRRRRGFPEDGRAKDEFARQHRIAVVDRRTMLRPAGEKRHGGNGLRRARVQRVDFVLGDIGHSNDFGRDRLDDQLLVRHDEAEALPMRGSKIRGDRGEVAVLHDERRVGALVFDMRLPKQRDALGCHALRQHLGFACAAETIERALELGQNLTAQRRLHRLLLDRSQIGESHAVGGEHAGERVNENARHAERIGHQARMLPAGAAEATQRVLGHVVASLDRDLLDRIGHALDGDGQKAFGDLPRTASIAGLGGDLVAERGEFFLDRLAVERSIARGPEQGRKELWLQLAEHEIAIGDGKRPAGAIAGRARPCAGGFRPDAIARAVERADGAAARRHGVDVHHRRAHAYARDQRLEAALEFAGVMRHVGRGATHVKGDDLGKAAALGGSRRADDPAGRSGQDRVLAGKFPRIREAAVRLHEHQPRLAQLPREPVDMTSQDRREIGIDNGRVAATDELHQRAHEMARRDLGEAQLARQRGDAPLVLGIPVAMHEHDRGRPDARSEGRSETMPRGVEIERD